MCCSVHLLSCWLASCYVAPCAPCGHVSVCSRCPQWPLKRCICSRTLPLFKMRSATGNLHHCVCFINIPVVVYSLWSKSGNMYLVCVGRPPFAQTLPNGGLATQYMHWLWLINFTLNYRCACIDTCVLCGRAQVVPFPPPSFLHLQVLAHRLGLIPILADPRDFTMIEKGAECFECCCL